MIRRKLQIVTTSVGLVLAGFLGARCGGGSTVVGVANLGTNTTTSIAGAAGDSGSPATLQANQLRYAKCMQTNGEPAYPEPGGNSKATVSALEKLNPNSATFQNAAKACRKYLPIGSPASPAERAKVQGEALKFAKCMQSHGMPSWPDPLPNGGYMVAPVGAAAHAPAYLKAAKICKPLLPAG